MIRTLAATCVAVVMSATSTYAQSNSIEPAAGTWKTWVISSGKDFRVPPPPDASATSEELSQIRELVSQAIAGAAAQIRFWDAGSPGYRWIELVNSRILGGSDADPQCSPHLYLSDDGDVRRHHRRMGIEVLLQSTAPERRWSKTLPTRLPTPKSPSYPSEHAAVAGRGRRVAGLFLP